MSYPPLRYSLFLSLLSCATACTETPSRSEETDDGTASSATEAPTGSSLTSAAGESTSEPTGSASVGADSGTTTDEATTTVSSATDGLNSSSGTTGEGTSRSQGCGLAAAGAGEFVEYFVDSLGMSRGFFVRLPADYDPDYAYPVVFGWHGSVSLGTPSAGLIGVSGIQSQFGDAAIAVGPSGGDTEFTWSEDGFSVSDATMDFFDQIIADVESNYCIDTGRVFTTGFSAGASVSNQLGCRRGSQIRATAAIAGLTTIEPCLDEPVAGWFLHGTQDGAVPFDHGLQARDRLLVVNECGEDSEPTGREGCTTYRGCAPGYPVVWCQHDGGHELQGSAYEQIWAFLGQFL